jgi:murein DD-endopeptidase MepM/ murein hydrolase activator NlpD
MSRKKLNVRRRKLSFEALEDRRVLSLGVPGLNLAFGGSAMIDDLSVARTDIAYFDGVTPSLTFDGSTHGIGSLTIDAFAQVENEWILSFTMSASVPGITERVADSDLVKYDAAAEVFSMYLDGSDVGLTSLSEDIDAVDELPDGRIVISTTGSVSVPGVSGKAQDLLVFTPNSLGENTAGSWAMYLKGSEIGLDRSTEDIDAVAVDGATIYISTSGSMSAGGISAADEDVVAWQNGVATIVCNGSEFGWSSYDIAGIELPSDQEGSTLHPTTLVNEVFAEVFGRPAGPVNTSYWQSRTDLAVSDLAPAMEQAQVEYTESAPQVSLTLYAFNAHGEPILSPTGVAEDDLLQARFANIPVGEEVGIHLVFNGVIVKTSTVTIGSSGETNVDIRVPNPLLPEVFSGNVSGSIDVLLIYGDQSESQTLQLREGPRLLLKSAEVTEGEYMYFAIRGVTADEPVIVTVRYDWGTGSKEQSWTIGRTDGSNRLDEANSKWPAPQWLRGEAQRDGIEIDITVGHDHRGYRATLLKGESRDDIIAQLVSSSGTSSIEAELAVLLTEEQRVLMDNLLGDDWEGNAAAIGNALDAFRAQGGGGFGGDLRTFMDQLVPGATQVVINALLLKPEISGKYGASPPLPPAPQYQMFQQLLIAFPGAYGIDHQNEVEEAKYFSFSQPVTPDSLGRDYIDYGGTSAIGTQHLGDDLFADLGDEVFAVDDGIVRFSKGVGGFMGTVIIEHTTPSGDTFYAMYAHLNAAGLPSEGSTVTQGQVIGTIGDYPDLLWPDGTIRDPLDHLHFEIRTAISPGGILLASKSTGPGYRRRLDGSLIQAYVDMDAAGVAWHDPLAFLSSHYGG